MTGAETLFLIVGGILGGVGVVGALLLWARIRLQASRDREETLTVALARANATLADERDRVQALLAGTDEALFALDAQRRVVLVNPAGLALVGGPAIGQPLGAVFVDPALAPLLDQHLTTGPRTFEVGVGQKWLLVRVTPQPDGWIIVMLDITRLRRLEKMRQDFVANVSHELRTPISVIRANAETLLDGAIDDPVAARRFVEALARNAERLTNLIADLLDVARIEAGKVKIELDAVAVGAVAALAAELVEGMAQERGVQLTLDVPEGLQVIADGKALEQVFINLLENAVKYAPSGTGAVALSATRAQGTVRIEVRDNGPGIAPAHRDRVFERFYRVDAGRSSDMGGTGLGLAIVKHLVAGMGGQVGLDPTVTEGSVFWVELPANPSSCR